MTNETLVFAGVPNKGHKIRSGYLTPAFSGAQKRVEVRPSPLCSRASPTKGTKTSGCLTSTLSGAQKRAEVLRNSCVLKGPKQGDKIRTACLTCTFSGAQKRAEELRNPYHSGVKRGRKCYGTRAFSGDPRQGAK